MSDSSEQEQTEEEQSGDRSTSETALATDSKDGESDSEDESSTSGSESDVSESDGSETAAPKAGDKPGGSQIRRAGPSLPPDKGTDGQQQGGGPSTGRSKTPREDGEASGVGPESHLESLLVPYYPRGKKRRNYTCNNARVWCIDRENQRLLQALSELSPRGSQGSGATAKARTLEKSPVIRVAHSAINRQRDQQRIERENLASLKRLVAAQPTKGLKCSELLADYHQQRYRGNLVHPMHKNVTKRTRTLSKGSSASRGRRAQSPATTVISSVRESGATPNEAGAMPNDGDDTTTKEDES